MIHLPAIALLTRKMRLQANAKSGFALVATISMMVLLVIVAIGLLSLSTISLRSSTLESAEQRAQANARMALMIAIGRLQTEMGPDQRISANGAILSDSTVNHPHWTGVWNSWIAEPIIAGGSSPVSAHQTITGISSDDSQMHPDYDKANSFRSWLVSLPMNQMEEPTAPAVLSFNPSLMPLDDNDAVTLVAEGSVGESAPITDYVHAPLVDVFSNNNLNASGRYGWWVGDESQKARIIADPYDLDESLTNAEKIYRSQAATTTGTKVVQGMENITDDSQLDSIPSFKTLDLISVDPAPNPNTPKISQQNFHSATIDATGVLADVREGGLKRDLSTILERDIKREENGDEFMLYKFADDGEDSVPIQDLSAYYQLYNNNPTWEGTGTLGGVQHPAAASRFMQVRVPDYGTSSTRNKFTRQYTALYRNPVPIKVQFVLGVGATNITEAERTYVAGTGVQLRESDRYKLLLGVKPVITLWNPSNLPMVMHTDASQIMKVSFPPFALRWKKYRADGAPAVYTNNFLNLNYAITNESTHGDARAGQLRPYIMKVQFAKNTPIVFQPGEVKMFSVPINANNFLESGGNSTFGNNPVYQAEEFLPDGFYVAAKSATIGETIDGIEATKLDSSNSNIRMVFGDDDKLDFQVVFEKESPISRAVSGANEVKGGAFQFSMMDSGLDGGTYGPTSHFRNYQFISRFGFGSNVPWDFNRKLMLSGFPDGNNIPFEGETNAIPGSDILAATNSGEAKALLNFSMMAGCETNEAKAGGAGAGRRITTRPFTHGSTLSAPLISGNEKKDLYDYSWEWQVNKINTLDEAFHDDGNSRGFYGGGYTAESGVTHVVQQYLPALPPISIASLSSAHLGGFSLANNTVAGSPNENIIIGNGMGNNPDHLRHRSEYGDFRQVTATGQGGLAPHTLQAIGNAYAHPNIPAAQAFTTYDQLLNMNVDDASSPPQRTYADHSYLANKALWDEFFFSSITPQLSSIPLYGGGAEKTAQEVASYFLFNDGSLPNRRFIPYTSNTNSDVFEELITQYSTYSDGFADKIASHLMITGAFNINSTSVEAWKVFFSSLKGKPLAYLKDQASSLETEESDDASIAPGMLPNGEAVTSSELSADANAPADQWTSSRSITGDEIDSLAVAMVEQVKKRGPFLSLSEFVNRRLVDYDDDKFALKGALQAALDDDSVSINAAFRNAERSMDGEIGAMTSAFSEALNGPIAYGSTPYIDQADILRQFGSLLTPRGDTFVIRAYGDSLDTNGKVEARAWCEAVVQRSPDYLDQSTSSGDLPYTKQVDLESLTNQKFGRKFKLIRFRWLNANEV